MDYIEVSFEIIPFKEDVADCITAEIVDLGFESFEITEPYLKAYIQKELYLPSHLKCIMSGFDNWEGVNILYTTTLIPEQNWNALWESNFDPIVIDKIVTVKALYHHLPLTKYNIKINPKMAFGTGHHQTTTLMIRALLYLNGEGMERLMGLVGWKNLKNKQILDMGTGTGVLAFLAAKMGAKRPVHAIDVDITAVNSAKENAWKNRLHSATNILYGDASLIQANKYDLLLANINRNILLEDISTYANGLKTGGVLVISGFYVADIPLLKQEGEKQGLTIIKIMDIEDWACVLFFK
ncbi:MAG: 50S ribosomal protein L11 methyltransferase [Bacteroidales bacterium]